jgi:DNA-binding CsgD family transcriptional regulator
LRERYAQLTPREREVMGRVVRGLLNKQIAAELGTSEVTVKLHRHQVMHTMQAESLAELVRMAEKLGIPATKSSSAPIPSDSTPVPKYNRWPASTGATVFP